jgi:hypothetical protein
MIFHLVHLPFDFSPHHEGAFRFTENIQKRGGFSSNVLIRRRNPKSLYIE